MKWLQLIVGALGAIFGMWAVWMLWLVIAAFQTASAAELPKPGEPGAIADARYCGEPARTESGRIKRSKAVLREFARTFPCPTTLEPVPSCPGWAIDHTIPLASGGCDTIPNLTWMPDEIKSCAMDWCKDRWERTYHATPRQPVQFEDEQP